jgi:tetratricopeptide (TPR) repeat protein
MSYKATAAYKDCAKLYRTALRKFPKSGVLYNEYAELFALEKEMEEAIAQWEKGIEMDPGYSSNYYNAAIYYLSKSNWIRASLYGEIFLNLESYTARTTEMKTQLFTAFKNLYSLESLKLLKELKTNSTFEKIILDGISSAMRTRTSTGNMNDLISVRARFVQEWQNEQHPGFSYRLFDHQLYLINQGLFEAYHYWLLSTTIPEEARDAWKKTHPKETEGFKAFQESRVFKLSEAAYYFNK